MIGEAAEEYYSTLGTWEGKSVVKSWRLYYSIGQTNYHSPAGAAGVRDVSQVRRKEMDDTHAAWSNYW